MGIVAKQSVHNTIITFLGFGIGAVNVLFFYTAILGKLYYGMQGYIVSVAMLLYPLIAFGIPNAIVKYYSAYSSEKDKNKLMTIFLLLPIMIGLLVGGMGMLLWGVFDLDTENQQLLKPYYWTVFVIGFAIAYFEVFYAYARVQMQSVYGNFLKEVFHRIAISIALGLVYTNFLLLEDFIYALTAIYVLRLLLMMIQAFKLRKPRLNFGELPNKKEVFRYAIYMLLAASIAIVLLDLDVFMIERFLPVTEIGVYKIAIFIAVVVGVPSRAMHQITYPLTAQLLNNGDMQALEKLYKKSASNLLLFAGFLLMLVLSNLSSLYALIPKQFPMYFNIVLLVGLAKLFDNALGICNAILFNSDAYKMALYFGIGVMLLAILLNVGMIPSFGIEGAAWATAISFFAYNIAKVYFVYRKFVMHPFQMKSIFILLSIAILTLVGVVWEWRWEPISYMGINWTIVAIIAIKSLLLSVLFWTLAYTFNFSEDFNAVLKKWLFSFRKPQS
ncbi:MAG: polysaccharide biosynthesis C-terminal domain-containing protein [Flavobacteriaceae bacterium]|nr:polysaccharide biosynthesis C-terminal domain-containing protein [Flavobacteriaceae bacterium]